MVILVSRMKEQLWQLADWVGQPSRYTDCPWGHDAGPTTLIAGGRDVAGRLCTFRTRGRAVGHVAGRVCTFRTRGGAVGPVAERRAGGACTPDGISGGGDGFSFIPHLSLLSSLL